MADIEKNEESGLIFFSSILLKNISPNFFWGPPGLRKQHYLPSAEKTTLSSLNPGVMWRRNQKIKSAGHFFSLDLANGQACVLSPVMNTGMNAVF